MPYKVAGTKETEIRSFKNPFPFRPLFPYYCPLDSSVINNISYDIIPEETLTNYCESTREFCVTEQVIDKTNIAIPTFLPTDSALWLDAEDSSTLTLVSGAVSEWRDKSGNLRHATQATAGNRPLFVANELNGTDVIRFDGSSDFLSTTLANLSQFSVFLVAKTNSTSLSSIIGSNTADTFGAFIGWVSATDFRVQANDNSNVLYNAFNNTNWNGINASYNATTISLFINAVSVQTANHSTKLFNFSQIGSRQTVNKLYFNGDISQVIIFDRVLTQAEREEIDGYLAWSTGLQGNLPVGHPYKDSYTGVTITDVTTCTDFYDFAQAP